MSAGDKEIILASEETNRKNILACIEHGNATRKMVLELKTMFDALQNQVIMQNKKVDMFSKQLAALQQQFYQAGTTSLNSGGNKD